MRAKTAAMAKAQARDSVTDRRAQYVDDARANKLALDEINKKLHDRPWTILGTLMYVKSLQQSKGDTTTQQDEAEDNLIPWPTTYTVHRKIPKYWLMIWLTNICGVWSPALLERVDKADTNAIRKILELGTSVPTNKALHPALRSKVLLSRFYSRLEATLGHRLKNFPSHAINESGHIDWSRVAAYSMEFADDDIGRKAIIRHRYNGWESQVRLAAGTADFELQQAHSDETCKVEHDTMKFFAKTRFTAPAAKNFFLKINNDALTNLATELQQDLDNQTQSLKEGSLEVSDEIDELKAAIKRRKVAPPSAPKPGHIVQQPPPEQEIERE